MASSFSDDIINESVTSHKVFAVALVSISPNTLWMMTVALGIAIPLLTRVFIMLTSSRGRSATRSSLTSKQQSRGCCSLLLAILALRIPVPSFLRRSVISPPTPQAQQQLLPLFDYASGPKKPTMSERFRRCMSASPITRIRVMGVLLVALGLLFAIPAESAFEERGFTPKHGDEVTMVVSDGVFAWSRNPIYLGAIFVNIGLAFIFDTMLMLLLTFSWWAYVQFSVIPIEEAALLQAFGSHYAAYMDATPRLEPRTCCGLLQLQCQCAMAAIIRPAVKADCLTIRTFIQHLAEYEREPDAVLTTVHDLEEHGFGRENPFFGAFMAMLGEKPAGFALYYTCYTTALGRAVYLEDLYVEPEFRKLGLGLKLFKAVQNVSSETMKLLTPGIPAKPGLLTLQVLDWNTPSIGFYNSLGGKHLKDILMYRLYAKQIAAFAAKKSSSEVIVREASPSDFPIVFSLMQELAADRGFPIQQSASEIERDGFFPHPVFRIHLGCVGGNIVAYSLSFFNYSTWQGPCLSVDDLYVRPSFRNKGVGTTLLHELAVEAHSNSYRRLVLFLRTPQQDRAKSLLERIGGEPHPGWFTYSFAKV